MNGNEALTEVNVQDQVPGRLKDCLRHGAEDAGPVNCIRSLAGTPIGGRRHGRGDPAHPVR
jgi:hypothetical protein